MRAGGFAALFVLLAGAWAVWAELAPHRARVLAQVVTGAVAPPAAPEPSAYTGPMAGVIAAAEAQVGVTLRYAPAYAKLAFPGGDIDPSEGVCTDVVIRALRAGAGVDLQLAVNRDMKANFAAYPKTWGLKSPDRNIDHRRVPNLETLLARLGAQVALGRAPEDFAPGDIVTSRLPGNLPHIMVVSARRGASGNLLVIHNIGAGAREEDALFEYPLKAQFRLSGAPMARLEALGR